MSPDTAFAPLRPRLFGVAYRMLGTASDADDVVQDAYLRWHAADRDGIRSPEAWLVTAVTRLAIDRLRKRKTERPSHVGDWLPAPIPTPAAEPAELSVAFLLLLERLGPVERAAFVLREVFDTDYADLARALDRSEAACRQLVHRARGKLRDGPPPAASAPEALVRQFLAALAADDQNALLGVLADGVVWTSDGGGRAPALRAPVAGAAAVAKVALAFQRQGRGVVAHELASLNGGAAIVTRVAGKVLFATLFAVRDGRIDQVYRVLDPDKLGALGEVVGPWGATDREGRGT